jgi:hypothetical protein
MTARCAFMSIFPADYLFNMESWENRQDTFEKLSSGGLITLGSICEYDIPIR